jgi:hypothetical protein
VERSFGTAQDRWVKELRLAGVTTVAGGQPAAGEAAAGAQPPLPQAVRHAEDAHRPLAAGHNLAAILSLQEERVVANDYTIRFRNRFFQLLKPVYPGEGGGRVVIEQRMDGSLAIRFGEKNLKNREIPSARGPGGAAPRPPEFSAWAADARPEEADPASAKEAGSPGIQPTAGRSGRTPAEPCPPGGAAKDNGLGPRRRAEDHPWRKPFQRRK